jgi:peptidoglycan-associated lipoprotein
MNRRRLEIARVGASLLACALFVLLPACHKKAPAPPPPPPPAPAAPAPAPAKATINSFSAEPTSIERGQTSTLRWSVSNATEISIDGGIGTVQSTGSRRVAPQNSTTYTLSASGPGGSDSRSVTVEVSAPPPPPPPPPAETPKPDAAQVLASDVHDAYFDFDKYNIRQDAQQVLTQDASALKQILSDYPGFTVTIEGHCDQRGSAEYNIGLGDRRATSAKDFLVQLGVPADRLKTISYGKERPVCTEQTEECYQRNRHVHFSPGQ